MTPSSSFHINLLLLDLFMQAFTGSAFSPAASQKTASQIEKETSLEPNKFNNGDL